MINSGSNPEFKKMAVIDRPDLSSTAEKAIAQDGINFEIGKDYILSAWVFLYSTTKTNEVFLQYGKSTFIREYTTLEIGKWTRVEMKFVADQNLANVYIGFRKDKIAVKMAVTGVQLVKGNYNTEWSPSPVEYETTIEANNSFIEQNKNQILSSVSKSEVDATLSKIATYETSYDIKSRAIKPLLEYNGVEFNDNYSYEVVAKTRYDGYETLAVATYISKGKGKGFDLTIIDEKGTTGAHPLFGIANNKPNITLYSSMVTQYTVDVIYTKYMGSASNIQRTNSQIKQVSDNITLSVDKVHEELDLNNMLLNSDFTSGFEGWGYVQEIYTIADKKEMSINSDSNMILNGAYRTDYVGTTNYNRTFYNLSSPLKVGRQYTLSFEYSLTAGSNSNIIGLLPYVPEDTYYRINAAQNTKITFTFTPTKSSTQILLYPADRNTPENNTAKATFSKVTLVEGEKPLDYKFGSSRNALKVNYNTNAGGYPSIISNFMNVGKGQEVSIGDELTLSAYIYVPSSAKNSIKNNIYFECATYENNKQSSNPAFMRYSLSPENIIYDTWVRYYVTGSVPETSANGKTNYIRALLRFNATSNAITDGVLFYYGLPQLEKGNTLTRWTPAKLDALSTEGLATKIALNPESIDIISQNLNINTDVLTIKNTKGNFTMTGDTFTISDSSGNNQTKISANGISIKSDGTDKMLNGMDMAEWEVRPYEPQFATWNNLPPTHSAAGSKYNGVQIVEPGRTGLYSITWGVYSFAKSYNQLLENNNTAYARVNRYTYVYNKRYLKIAFSSTTSKGVSLILRAMDSTGGIQMAYQKIVDTSYTYPVFIIDLQKSLGYKADNKVHYFELQAGLTTNSGYSNDDNGSFRITRMSMTDFNE